MRTIVLSLGGSIIAPDDVDYFFLKEFKNMVMHYLEEDYRFIIFCGGGGTNSRYNFAAQRVSEIPEEDLDWIGIMATRLNAELIRAVFSANAYVRVVYDPTERITTDRRIIVGAGWKPGWSTDYDSVVIAEQFDAKEIINLTNISHIYDKDPKKHDDAQKMYQLTWSQYKRIVGNKWVPRLNSPFDPIASKKAAENGLKVVILKGTDLNNIKNYLDGRDFVGSVISDGNNM